MRYRNSASSTRSSGLPLYRGVNVGFWVRPGMSAPVLVNAATKRSTAELPLLESWRSSTWVQGFPLALVHPASASTSSDQSWIGSSLASEAVIAR